MADFKIEPITHQHLTQVNKWPSRHFAPDTLLKKPAESAVRSQDNYGWSALRNEEVLAVVTVKLNKERVGYLNCIVKPGEEHQGIATKMVDYALEQPQVSRLAHLHAAIDPDNTAARQILREHGFTFIGNDSEGYLEYAKHMHY